MRLFGFARSPNNDQEPAGGLNCCLCSGGGHLALAGVQIRGIEIRIALPEERRFSHVVAFFAIACYYLWRDCVKRNWMRQAYVKRVVASVTGSRLKMYENERVLRCRS
jgi:hypothetical protein